MDKKVEHVRRRQAFVHEATVALLRHRSDLGSATRLLAERLCSWMKADLAVFSFVIRHDKKKPQRIFFRQNPQSESNLTLTTGQVKDIALLHDKLPADRPFVRLNRMDASGLFTFCGDEPHTLSAPLSSLNRRLGGVTIIRNKHAPPFSELDGINLADTLSDLSELFIMLIEEAQGQADEEVRRALNQIAGDLFRTSDLESLQRFVCKKLSGLFEVNTVLTAPTGETLAKEDGGSFNWQNPTLCLPVEIRGEIVAVLVFGARAATDSLPDPNDLEDFLGQLKPAWDNARRVAELLFEIRTDRLTGLLHRDEFLKELTVQLQRSRTEDNSLSLLVATVDQFDRMQRKLGRAGSDAVLKTLAEIVKSTHPSRPHTARVGEAAFGVLLPRVDLEPAIKRAESLRERLREPFSGDSDGPKISIGLSVSPLHGLEAEELLFSAEQAASLAGFQGGDQIAFIGSERVKNLMLRAFVTTLKNSPFETGPVLLRRFSGQMAAIHPATAKSSSVVEIVTSLAQALDAKDHYTGSHSAEASRLGKLLAEAAGLSPDDVELVRMGTLLHDVGKIGVPERILRSPTKLTEDEWEIMKRHPVIGEEILKPIPALREVALVVRHHHERWDGRGYPDKLEGEAIPVGSRIVSLVDTYHAIVSHRPYRAGASPKNAIEEIKRFKGTQYDPVLVDVLEELLRARNYELKLDADLN